MLETFRANVLKRQQDRVYRSSLIWTEGVFQVFQDMSVSEYSESESVSLLNEPTGSVQEKAVRENSSDNGIPNLARKRHGDNGESSSPKKARTGSQHESLAPNDSPTDTGAKEPEDVGSVRLRLGGFPVSPSQIPRRWP